MPRISKNGDPRHALGVKSRADALTWCRRAHGSNAPAGLWTVGGGSPPACAGGYCLLPLPGRKAVFKAVLRCVGAGQEPSGARLGTPRARATLNGSCGDERRSNAPSRLGEDSGLQRAPSPLASLAREGGSRLPWRNHRVGRPRRFPLPRDFSEGSASWGLRPRLVLKRRCAAWNRISLGGGGPRHTAPRSAAQAKPTPSSDTSVECGGRRRHHLHPQQRYT